MSAADQVVAVVAITAICCSVIKIYTPGLSAVLSLTACVMIVIFSFRFFAPIMATIERLRELSGLSTAVIAPMFKVTGIGILTQISCALCEDTGEKALQHAVEISGMVLSLYTAAPLMGAVLDLLEGVLQ